MPRTNKKTRIKGVPPKLQLQQKDARTGSYSSHVRIASDGRTGNYTVNFDDQNTVIFGDRAKFDNLFVNSIVVKDMLMGYWKFNSGSFVSRSNGNWKVDYPLVPNPPGYLETQVGGIGKNYTDAQLTMYVTGNTLEAVTPITDDLPFPIRVGGEGNPFGSIAGAMRFQHNISSNSALWSIASVYSGTLFMPRQGGPGGSEDGFAVSAWVKLTSSGYPGTGATVVCKAGLSRTNVDWSLDIDNNGLLVFSVYDDLSNKIENSSSVAVPLNEWTMVRGGYNGSFGEEGIFVQVGNNNKETESNLGSVGSYAIGQTYNSNPIVIGGYDLATPNFPGYICEVAFWNMFGNYEHQLQPGVPRVGVPISEIQDSLVVPADGVVAGIGLGKNSKWLEDSEQFTDLILPNGTIRAGVGDTQVHFTPGQDLTPFKDNNLPEVDGKSSGSPFYATGSDPNVFGTALQQPLWSKTKIEIDITPRIETSASMIVTGGGQFVANSRRFPEVTGSSYEMLYYNFAERLWQGVGTGTPIGLMYGFSSTSPRGPFEDHVMVGFTPGIISGSNKFTDQNNAGRPFNNLGFPWHPKYHATSSQLLNMSDYISEPFLIEKIVVELSAAYTMFPSWLTTSSFSITHISEAYLPGAINNFFIMNQRKQAAFTWVDEYENALDIGGMDGTGLLTVPGYVTLSAGASGPTYVTTNRDLIAWGGISSFAANMPTSATGTNDITGQPRSENPMSLMSRDYVIISDQNAVDDLTPVSWDQQIKLELIAQSPVKNSTYDQPTSDLLGNEATAYIARYNCGPTSYKGGIITVNYLGPGVHWRNGGRNGLGVTYPDGRTYTSPIATIQPVNQATLSSLRFIEPRPTDFGKDNPYLLLPGDQLIIGWQQPPFNKSEISGKGSYPTPPYTLSEIKFPASPGKIIFYGSRLSQNTETHDTLNQLLISDTVHEVIGND